VRFQFWPLRNVDLISLFSHKHTCYWKACPSSTFCLLLFNLVLHRLHPRDDHPSSTGGNTRETTFLGSVACHRDIWIHHAGDIDDGTSKRNGQSRIARPVHSNSVCCSSREVDLPYHTFLSEYYWHRNYSYMCTICCGMSFTS
jgi:hypothetical protein